MNTCSNRRLSNYQRPLLEDLLGRLERGSGGRMVSVRVSAGKFPAYFDDEHPARIRAWEEDMLSLREMAWIKLDYGKGADHHRITRIRINEQKASDINLALGIMEISTYQQKALALIELFTIEGFNAAFFRDERERLLGSQPPSSEYREERLGEMALVYEAISKIIAMQSAEPARRLTWRQFSTLFFADSKKLDRLKPRITQILYQYALTDLEIISIEESASESAAVLSYFGIESKEEVLLLCGPVRFSLNGGNSGRYNSNNVDGCAWQPFLPIPASLALSQTTVWDLSAITGILTIENEESFHAWAKNPEAPSWLTVYAAGFPSSAKLQFLKRLCNTLGPERPVFHWGDLDCGGIEILLFIEARLGRPVAPLGMGPEILEKHRNSCQTMTATETGRIKRIRTQLLTSAEHVSHPILPTIDAILRTELKLEQEALIRLL